MTFSDLIRLSPRLWLLLCLWLVGGVLPNMYVAGQPTPHHAGIPTPLHSRRSIADKR